jgi:hypothetical protein
MLLTLIVVFTASHANPDSCVNHKKYRAWMERLKGVAKADDIVQFRKVWTAVCAEASASCGCREMKGSKRDATDKMYSTGKPMESTFQINLDADNVVLFYFGPRS